MQSKIKEVFDEGSLVDSFSKELYKKVRNNAKKLDKITKYEEQR